MACAAEFDLARCRELARIKGRAMALSVLVSARMATLALYSGDERLEVFADACRVAGQTRLKIVRVLLQTERGIRICRSACVLPDGDTVLMKLRKIADARFSHRRAGANQRSLPLSAGSEHPFDHPFP